MQNLAGIAERYATFLYEYIKWMHDTRAEWGPSPMENWPNDDWRRYQDMAKVHEELIKVLGLSTKEDEDLQDEISDKIVTETIAKGPIVLLAMEHNKFLVGNLLRKAGINCFPVKEKYGAGYEDTIRWHQDMYRGMVKAIIFDPGQLVALPTDISVKVWHISQMSSTDYREQVKATADEIIGLLDRKVG